MSRYQSDYLDDACEEMLGHNNWAYLDTISKKEMAEHKKNNSIETIIVFYKDPLEEEIND